MNDDTDELFRLVRDGNVKQLQELLQNNEDININCTRWSGFSLLHRAAGLGMSEICELLILHGADVKMRSTRGWYTPLHIALANGYVDTAMVLVEHGANPWSKSKYKEDPFEYGGKRGFRRISEEFRIKVMKLEMNKNLQRHKDLLQVKNHYSDDEDNDIAENEGTVGDSHGAASNPDDSNE